MDRIRERIKTAASALTTLQEVKNRLSYYLKLVKGGEQVEIFDRKTPLARIVHVSDVPPNGRQQSSWIQEARELGLVKPPAAGALDVGSFEKVSSVQAEGAKRTGVLQALLNERESGR